MSAKLLNLVWERFPAGGEDLLIMIVLAFDANDSGDCYMSSTELAVKPG